MFGALWRLEHVGDLMETVQVSETKLHYVIYESLVEPIRAMVTLTYEAVTAMEMHDISLTVYPPSWRFFICVTLSEYGVLYHVILGSAAGKLHDAFECLY